MRRYVKLFCSLVLMLLESQGYQSSLVLFTQAGRQHVKR